MRGSWVWFWFMFRRLVVNCSSLQLKPTLTAVSILSPVRTQFAMLAFRKVSMASPTPSCSMSSMAVAPSKARFCSSWAQASSIACSLPGSVRRRAAEKSGAQAPYSAAGIVLKVGWRWW